MVQAELDPYFGVLGVEHLGLFNRDETLLGFAPSPKGRRGLKPQIGEDSRLGRSPPMLGQGRGGWWRGRTGGCRASEVRVNGSGSKREGDGGRRGSPMSL